MGFFEKLKECFSAVGADNPQDLNEGFFSRKTEIEKNVKSFDIMPNPTDITFESWIMRCALYGKPHWHYRNTEQGVSRKVHTGFFLDIIERDHILKAFNSWDVSKPRPDTVVMSKKFWGMNGRMHEEVFTMRVEFRPEVKRILNNY